MTSPDLQNLNLYNFDPGYVESLIVQGNWGACWDYLGQIIENLTLTASPAAAKFNLQLQKDMQDPQKREYVNQFGMLLGELLLYIFTNEQSVIPDKSFYRLIHCHETIHTLFYIFGVADTDEAAKKILGDGKRKLSESQQKKLLLLLSLETKLDILDIFKRLDTPYKVAGLISYIGHRKMFMEKSYDNKTKLYSLRHHLEKAYGRNENFSHTINIYFLSSYMDIPNRHEIKKDINATFRHYLNANAKDFRKIKSMPRDTSRLTLDPSKPVVLVIAEEFAKIHAMYRCWGERTHSISSEYNIVFTMPQDKADPQLQADYKNFIPFTNMGMLYLIIHNAQPDIIFMPSVGMRFYNVAISNLRAAPIQIMGLGHPATTMSEHIDYVLGTECLYDPAAFPTDIVVDDGYPAKCIPLATKERFFEPPKKRAPDSTESGRKIIRIGVAGSDIKVSAPFFAILKEIVAESPYEIHVSFFMGVGGIDSLYMEKFIRENFKNSAYYGWQPYGQYLDTLKTVDIVLNPFPFGHTNTVIDTLMCGIPFVGLNGAEPSSKTEAEVLKGTGLEDLFIVHSKEDYKKKFSEFADKIAQGQRDFFDREKVYDHLFKKNEAEKKHSDYGKVFKWLQENHAQIKASGKKFIKVFEEIN